MSLERATGEEADKKMEGCAVEVKGGHGFQNKFGLLSVGHQRANKIKAGDRCWQLGPCYG